MEDIKLDIATAKHRNSANWRNRKTMWSEVCAQLEETHHTHETQAEFFKMPKDKQDEVKDVGGFVGGYLKDGKRRKANIMHRQLVALDADHAPDLDVWLECKRMEFAACMYTTHKHTRKAPRYRIVFPLDRKVTPDEYEAIARVVADWLDIDNFDDTTYQPNRLMHYPSTSKDAEFIYDYADFPILSADEVLGQLADWTDPTTWPRSSRERERIAEIGIKDVADDPAEKKGVIGAFCRNYTITEAIDEFLSEVYKRKEADRWTYQGGSSSGGLVVYDDTFAYSYHESDPIGDGHVYNAFDMVRVHLYGELDEGKSFKDISKAPSYKAMNEFAGNLKDVKKALIDDRRAAAEEEYKDDFEDYDRKARKKAAQDDWVERLEMEANGKQIKNTIANCKLIFENDEKLKGCFGFNEFAQREMALKKLPWDRRQKKYPRPLADHDDAEIRHYMEAIYNITGRGQILDGLTIVLRANSYNPIEDYLEALEWDGVERLDWLYIDLFGAVDDEYTRAIARKAHVAAVARVFEPGCKYDQAPIIVGDQGVGKSTYLAKMGMSWFTDSLITIQGKEALESIQGSWIVELGELASLRRAESDAVKRFISASEDKFRVAYGKRTEDFPRRCVFFGTTNEEDFLRDATGNRRYWIINVLGRVGAEEMNVWNYLDRETVDQLWAEAKHYYYEGETFAKLPKHLAQVASDIQDMHLEKDERLGIVREYLTRELPEEWDSMDTYEKREWMDDPKGSTVVRDKVCVLELWAVCLRKDPNSITRMDSFAISRLMKSLREWIPLGRTLKFGDYGNQKAYINIDRREWFF